MAPLSGAPTQRPYQLEAGDKVEAAYFDQGLNRLLVKKPTGTGKTVWFAGLLKRPRIAAWLEARKGKGAKMFVVAHREELLDQAAAKIRAQNPGLMVDIEQGDRHANRFSDVVIASVPTLQATSEGRRFRRLERLLKWHQPAIVVIDEAHHAAADTYRTALAHMGFLPMAVASDKGNAEAATQDDVVAMTQALAGWDRVAPKDQLLIGVTATPNRTDAVGLGCVFQTIAYSYALKQAIEDGYLVPIVPWAIETASSLDGVGVSRGDFKQGELAEAVNTPARNRLGIEAWQLYAGDRPTIAFTVDVQHAIDLAEMWRGYGVKAAVISGKTPKDERRQILEDYRRGRVQVLCNCMVLTEGTDLPAASCIAHFKPTKSPTLYEQMTGRGLRPLADVDAKALGLPHGDPVGPERVAALAAGVPMLKADCIVLDLVDVSRRHSLMTAPVLYGLPPGLKTKGRDVRKDADELEALREKYPQIDDLLEKGRLSLEELRDRASTFDVFTIPSMGDLAEHVTLKWLPLPGGRFRLAYPWSDGYETIEVSPDVLGHYDLSLTLRVDRNNVRQRTIAAQIPTVLDALRLAETFVRDERASVAKMKNSDAPWRQRPATPGQLSFLAKLRVPFNRAELAKPGGAGKASDMIDMAKARRG